MAPACSLHDYCLDFLYPVPDRLYHLPRACRGEINPLQRRGHCRNDLFPDAHFAYRFGVYYSASGNINARSGIWPSMGSPSANRPMDLAGLALRIDHWRSRLPYALPMVPAAEPCTWEVIDV